MALVAAGACSDEGVREAGGGAPAESVMPRPSDTSNVGALQDTVSWTLGTASAAPSATPPPLPIVSAVTAETLPDRARVTIELVEVGGVAPGYRVEYVDRPLHECGSGRQIHPVGDAWLEIRLEPAAAHSESGEPTLAQREIPLEGPLLQRLYRTCDFEGVVTFVLALSTPNPFRVARLSGPARIVVEARR